MNLGELVQTLQAAQERRHNAVELSRRQIALRSDLPPYMSSVFDNCFMQAMKMQEALTEDSDVVLQLAWILRISE